MPSERKLFVEGGGDNQALRIECRQAFRRFLERAGFGTRMPRIVACGARKNAYDQFCAAFSELDAAILLVDSEGPVTAPSAWDHVKQRAGDRWDKPSRASDDNLHFMVQCMETWFLADRPAMQSFFGNGYKEASLPAATRPIEEVPKDDLFVALKAATKDTKTKGYYAKGPHSFKLLAEVNPKLVRDASPSADRFLTTLDRLM
jgi:hypothetical protein